MRGSGDAGPQEIVPSVQIGRADESELDGVLNVMCATFQLPFDVALPIYYDDPWFEPQNRRVL